MHSFKLSFIRFALGTCIVCGFIAVANSAMLMPFIHGGDADPRKFVVLIQITARGNNSGQTSAADDNKKAPSGGGSQATYCTGTVVGKWTILTAAHCLAGHENALFKYYTDRAPVLSNPPPNTPLSKPAGQVQSEKGHPSFIYPGSGYKKPARGCGLCYDSSSNVHDIGLLFTEDPIPAEPVELPKRALDWATIIGQQSHGRAIDFSGYGLVDPEDKNGNRNRTHATWHVDRADDWIMSWSQDPSTAHLKSTCDGDSGGPALRKINETQWMVIAVTSTGDSGVCSSGTSTRVDPYLAWILDHLKA